MEVVGWLMANARQLQLLLSDAKLPAVLHSLVTCACHSLFSANRKAHRTFYRAHLKSTTIDHPVLVILLYSYPLSATTMLVSTIPYPAHPKRSDALTYLTFSPTRS